MFSGPSARMLYVQICLPSPQIQLYQVKGEQYVVRTMRKTSRRVDLESSIQADRLDHCASEALRSVVAQSERDHIHTSFLRANAGACSPFLIARTESERREFFAEFVFPIARRVPERVAENADILAIKCWIKLRFRDV